jgi:acetyl esterase/lipase
VSGRAFYIDPEIEAAIQGTLTTDISDVAEARRRMAEIPPPASPLPRGLARDEVLVPSRGTGRGVRTLVYTPSRRARGERRIAALFLHGGGFVMGSIDRDQSFSIALADRVGVTAVSVDYRLAPEHPYPAAVDDAEDALSWLRSGALAGAARDGVIIVGFSAGACLAAAVTGRAVRAGHAPRALIMENPVLDDRLATASSGLVGTPLWDHDAAVLSWRYYLASITGDVPADAAPARGEDFSGWPPVYIAASALDPLRDEGVEFAQRLADAQVPVELHLYPGTFHGSHVRFPDAEVSRRLRNDSVAAVERHI